MDPSSAAAIAVSTFSTIPKAPAAASVAGRCAATSLVVPAPARSANVPAAAAIDSTDCEALKSALSGRVRLTTSAATQPNTYAATPGSGPNISTIASAKAAETVSSSVNEPFPGRRTGSSSPAMTNAASTSSVAGRAPAEKRASAHGTSAAAVSAPSAAAYFWNRVTRLADSAPGPGSGWLPAWVRPCDIRLLAGGLGLARCQRRRAGRCHGQGRERGDQESPSPWDEHLSTSKAACQGYAGSRAAPLAARPRRESEPSARNSTGVRA